MLRIGCLTVNQRSALQLLTWPSATPHSSTQPAEAKAALIRSLTDGQLHARSWFPASLDDELPFQHVCHYPAGLVVGLLPSNPDLEYTRLLQPLSAIVDK